MNDFQRKCVEASLSILKEKGLEPCQFQEIKGKTQTYLKAQFAVRGHQYELYVYEDEAGVAMDERWSICETPDFKSPDELIKGFCKILNERLSQGTVGE